MKPTTETDVTTRGLGHRRDTPLRWFFSGWLFIYMGVIVLVISANALWLNRLNPLTGETYLSSLLANEALRSEVWFAFKLSMVTSLTTAFLGVLLGIPAAYALSRLEFRGREIIDTIIDLPLVIPPLIAGIALLLFFRQSWPGRFFEEHIMSVVYTQQGIVVAQFFIGSAFAIRALKAIFDQINPRFEAVARSLGSSALRAFVTVTLPLARNGIIAGFIMTWARALGEFAPVMMVAGATPGRTNVLPISAFLNMSAGNVEASIAIVVLMVFIAAFTLVAFKRLGGQGYIW